MINSNRDRKEEKKIKKLQNIFVGTRSRKSIFVGYPFGKKAWRLYDLESNEFFTSRDVVFFEDKFPGIEDSGYVWPPDLHTNLPLDDWLLMENSLDSKSYRRQAFLPKG